MTEIALVLLAAGGSSRMGKPKPLLPWGHSTLLENRIETLQKLQQPITLLLGSKAAQIAPQVTKKTIKTVIHSHWNQGMGSSIAFAVQSLMRQTHLPDGVLFTTIDQPLVDADYLNQLLTQFRPQQKHIIVSQSDTGWKGIPVLFDKEYFHELAGLSGDEGAKTVVKKYSHHVQYLMAGYKLVDMDTPEQYERLLKSATNPNH